MGSRFRYVSDDALDLVHSSMMPNCHVCQQMAEEVFNYPETVVLEGGVEDSISQACAVCLAKGPNVKEHPHLLNAVRKYFKGRKSSAEAGAESAMLQRFACHPRPMMPQGTDWPICCDDFCELIASGSSDLDLADQTSGASFWDYGPVTRLKAAILIGGQAEFGEDLLMFRCLTCAKTYFTFQPT